MKQPSLASQAVFEKFVPTSRRELFLEEMEQVVPWCGLQALMEPHCAKEANGRRPVGLAIMLRTNCLQQRFNLSDPVKMKRCTSRRRCGGLWAWTSGSRQRRMRRLSAASATCWRRRYLGGLMLDTVKVDLKAKSIRIATGTVVDATIMHAPSSTKNRGGDVTRRCIRRRRASSGTSA